MNSFFDVAILKKSIKTAFQGVQKIASPLTRSAISAGRSIKFQSCKLQFLRKRLKVTTGRIGWEKSIQYIFQFGVQRYRKVQLFWHFFVLFPNLLYVFLGSGQAKKKRFHLPTPSCQHITFSFKSDWNIWFLKSNTMNQLTRKLEYLIGWRRTSFIFSNGNRFLDDKKNDVDLEARC